MKQSKKQLRRRIKELEADNKTLADINCNFCLEMACLSSANRALQARLQMVELGDRVRRAWKG